MPTEVKMIPITEVHSEGDFNPRLEIEVSELTESVKEHGIIQPLTVTPENGHYKLLAGERRLTAAHLASLTEVPVLIREPKDTENAEAEALTIALIENVQRQALTPVEEARAIQRLKEAGYRTIKQLAHKLSWTQKKVKDRLLIAACPAVVQDLMQAGELPFGTAGTFARIAETSPRLAEIVAHRADRVRANTIEDFDYAWVDALEPDEVYDPDTDEYVGTKPIGGVWWNKAPLPIGDLNVSEETKQKLIDANEESPYGIKTDFSDDDTDAARAYGCLIEVEPPNDAYVRASYVVTDLDWLAERIESHCAKRWLAQAKKDIKERQAYEEKRQEQSSSKSTISNEAKARGVSEDEVRAERKVEREEMYELQDQAATFNRNLGEQLFERLNEVPLSPEVADALVGLVFRDQAGEVFLRGLTYVHPGHIEEEELKNGRTKRTFTSRTEDARQALTRFVSEAKTPEQLIGRIFQALLAAHLADERVVARSNRRGHQASPGYDAIEKVDDRLQRGLDKVAKQLTPKLRKDAEARRKDADSE